MALAWHVIFTTYGFWLPNDPRGSWSDFVGSWELLRFGGPSKVETHRSLACVPHDASLRRAAKAALRWPAVHLSGRQALAAAHGFAQAAGEGGYRIHGCSILPDHVHMVVARHERTAGRLIGHLKGRATQRLAADGLWPPDRRPVWGHGGWNVFLDTPEDVSRAVAYVEANPAKEGKPRQRWSFVTPFVCQWPG